MMLATLPALAADALFRSSFESSICDDAFPEAEPNDTAATATSVVLSNSTGLACGSISPAGDFDYFEISLSASQTLLVETIRADGTPCDASIPMSLVVYGPSLNAIDTDNNGGIGGCASLDGLTLPSLQGLPAGNYYIRVQQSDDNLVVPLYALRIMLL